MSGAGSGKQGWGGGGGECVEEMARNNSKENNIVKIDSSE